MDALHELVDDHDLVDFNAGVVDEGTTFSTLTFMVKTRQNQRTTKTKRVINYSDPEPRRRKPTQKPKPKPKPMVVPPPPEVEEEVDMRRVDDVEDADAIEPHDDDDDQQPHKMLDLRFTLEDLIQTIRAAL